MKKTNLFITLAFVLSVLIGFGYTAVQQNYRQGANDPQIQMAEDTASQLASGVPASHFNNTPIDPSKSLTPFIIVYNGSGRVVASSVGLNKQTPSLPNGVLDFVTKHGEDRFTWQPAANVRIAAVATSYHGQSSGYILTGRSLKEVEKREDQLTLMALAAWLVGLFGTLVLVSGLQLRRKTT